MAGHEASPVQQTKRMTWIVLDFALPILLLLCLTFILSPHDVDFQRPHFNEGEGFGERDGFWGWLYTWGPLPAVVVSIGAIAALIYGFRNAEVGRWRRVCIFVILVGIVGPGVVTNGILKEYWGRPRPREIVEFDGRFPFEPVLTIDPVSTGKSFPCGHATMGYFFVVGYFVFRRRRRAMAMLWLIGGLGFGALLSYMRMIQGGHFATDGLWSAGVIFLISAGMFHLLGLNRKLLDDPGKSRRKIPWWVTAGGVVTALGVVTAVLFGTPYSATREISPLEADSLVKPLKVSVRILEGDVEVVSAEQFYVTGKAWGHGVPTSQIAEKFREEESDGGAAVRLKYHQRSSGFFTESGQTLKVGIPWSKATLVELTFGPGEVEIALEDVFELQRIAIGVQPGTRLTLIPPRSTPVWCQPAVAEALGISDLVIVSEEKPSREGEGLIEIQLSEEFAE